MKACSAPGWPQDNQSVCVRERGDLLRVQVDTQKLGQVGVCKPSGYRNGKVWYELRRKRFFIEGRWYLARRLLVWIN